MTDAPNRERVVVLAILGVVFAVAIVMAGIVLISLSDANMTSLGHWVDEHGSDVWKAGITAATAAATFLLGHRRGRSMGTSDTEIADAAAAEGVQSGSEAAALIRAKAEQRKRRRP